jgi:asparagine synthase (glutamine-hydrolysing)
MCGALAHRGPDGSGATLFVDADGRSRTGFAHRRLSIIDTSAAGTQPMGVDCDRCGAHSLEDLALTYNGELYNFPELKAELQSLGHSFRTGTDTEVLLHLYGEHGTGMLQRLNGIFAFALREGRARTGSDMHRGDVLVARDPLGVKPLYVTETPAGVSFASEIKALLLDEAVSRELDHEALHYMLAYLWTPAPRTMLKAVRRLEAGAAMVLHAGRRVREWKYYDLPTGLEPLPGSFDDVAEAVRVAFDRAVDRQMIADVPVGAFLSGGLDSSAVVASMRATHPDADPVCYCIGFAGDAGFDGTPADLPYARRVARHLGVRLHEVIVDASMVNHLDRTIWALDEPQADPAPINSLLIADRARADGIPVLLSGTGGDDLFSGYRRHNALRLERTWSWLPATARQGLASAARVAAGRGPAWARRASKAFAHADLSGDRRMVSYFWWSGEALRRGLYAPDLANELQSVDTAAPMLASLRHVSATDPPLQRMLYLETRHFLGDHNLNYADKTGMAAGIEIRVPFLDLELVTMAARIPATMKQRGSVGKAVLKRAMEGRLPRDVIYRGKTGFGVPLRHWLRHELRESVDDVLSPSSIRRRGLFDASAVRSLVERDRAGVVDGSYTVFALYTLERWCRMFVDPPRPTFTQPT